MLERSLGLQIQKRLNFFFLIRSHSLELIIVCGFFPPIAVDFNWIQLKQDKIY